METIITAAAAVIVGMLSGQGLMMFGNRRHDNLRIDAIERIIPELISRNEVQAAFQQVAQIEAQRIAQQQQVARQSQVFGGGSVPPSANLNTSINSQLAALNERLAQLNAQIPD